MNNHPTIIDFLLASPAARKLELNSSAVDGDGCSMLHHAARKGALEALTKILQLAPGLIYLGDVRSNTALHYAAMNGTPYPIKITQPALGTSCCSTPTMTDCLLSKTLGESWPKT